MENTRLAAKLDLLRRRLTALSPGLLALSGGLDSRVLAHLAWSWELEFRAVHVRGPHVPPAETAYALAWAASLGKTLEILDVDPLAHEGVCVNDKTRCYHCKKAMFQSLGAWAERLGLSCMIEGSQASDATVYRPGRQALAELGIVSPMAEVDLSKPELRAIARSTGMADPEQAARPCLLTRLEYGLRPTQDMLAHLAACEAELAVMGLLDFRLRMHRDGRAVLQVSMTEAGLAERLARPISEALQRHGLGHAELLVTGSVSGYFDN
ncbi:PP-loop superfamily ATP-utilizing enzyme [Desulfocurvibacter africanus PCS]|uniref:PP-loop superfamily ATP-utilizing enzyme n=1 Tax=Desulfocurvibacter africanus PCS TaxID=1262666 RepID=M5Q225_DESAF|nr:hypothetical protein [Desulfocurvibacter africanus]EMG38081.1 PP-loop superfamily ATP-utilizing enzyme [Desulfocurvibacter africanus PCS]